MKVLEIQNNNIIEYAIVCHDFCVKRNISLLLFPGIKWIYGKSTNCV